MSKQLLHYNQTVSADMVRRENIDGADCIVIRSATLPDNIVMNGGLYPAEEIEKSFASLERVLAPVGHPTKNGKFISATDPYAVHNFDVGAYVANVKRENGKVYHDTVINIEVANRSEKGKALIKAVENMEATGEPIHTSTGIFLERETLDAPQTNLLGQEYNWIAKGMMFDHNAILLNEQGAATPTQGVGMMVNAAEVDMATFAEEESLDELIYTLKDALKDHLAMMEAARYIWIADIYQQSGRFVYEIEFENGADEYRERSFSVDADGNVTVGSEYKAVKRKFKWVANKKLESFMQNMKFASPIQEAYNESVNNQSNEELDMTPEEMQALLDAQAEKMQANFDQKLAPLSAKIDTLEANAKADAQAKADAEKAEREALAANAKELGFDDSVIEGMTTNSLKAVVGKTSGQPAATRTAGGQPQVNSAESEFSRELP